METATTKRDPFKVSLGFVVLLTLFFGGAFVLGLLAKAAVVLFNFAWGLIPWLG